MYADDQTWAHTIPNHNSDEWCSLGDGKNYRWCVDNCMKLNLNKIKQIIVHNFRVMPTIQTWKVDLFCIERVSTICALGVNLQDNLSWSRHVEAIVKLMKQLTFAFFFLSFSRSQQNLKHLFCSVIMPMLLYSCPAWCNLTAGRWNSSKGLWLPPHEWPE